MVKKDGKDGLTRANLLAELGNIHDFNASGMVATTDIGNRTGSACFMLDQFKGGKFVRIYPTKKGTFDCNKSNIYTRSPKTRCAHSYNGRATIRMQVRDW